MDTISSFDFEILYHPGKANTVADALSRAPVQTARLNVAYGMMKEYESLAFLAECDVSCPDAHGDMFIAALTVTPSLIEKVKEAQLKDPKVGRIIEDAVIDNLDGCPTPWRVGKEGALRLPDSQTPIRAHNLSHPMASAMIPPRQLAPTVGQAAALDRKSVV